MTKVAAWENQMEVDMVALTVQMTAAVMVLL